MTQFKTDLASEAYAVITKESSMRTPEEVRSYLKNTYDTTAPRLKGAILIGDIPKPRYRVVIPALPGVLENSIGPDEYVSMQFYQDLDGTYSQNRPNSCERAGCYDGHTGAVGSEIWVSVLPFLTSDETTVEKVNQYFAKNHAYRTGVDRPRKGYLRPLIGTRIDTVEKYEYQIASLTTGSYAWTPLTSRGNIGIFMDNSLGDPVRYPQAAYGFETALLTRDYDFAEIGAHGTPTTIVAPQGGSIVITTQWVNSHKIGATFAWDYSCYNGDLDVDGNLLTALVYSDGDVLLAAGATGEYGGLGTNAYGFWRPNIGQALAAGKTFGQAYLDHINAPFAGSDLYQREFYVAPTVFVGDLTLNLQEHMN